MNKIESIVIVKGEHGSVATLRFANSVDDVILSSFNNSDKSKNYLYESIEKHVKKVQENG